LTEAKYLKCKKCGYEFLSQSSKTACPKCKNQTFEEKDSKALLGFDD
jgi:predicted Zn-ribbon and HTH transcriptional regulator